MRDGEDSAAGGAAGAGWDAGWEGHAREQRRRIAALPLWVRIDWLEETQPLVLALRVARTGADEPDSA